jgi:Holliday junction resolvase RusA-like endonuclease
MHRLELHFPWAALASDNERHTVQRMRVRGKLVATIGSSARYREAKAAVAMLARGADGVRGEPLPLFREPVRIVGFLTFPDRRERDAGNYGKMLKDALEGIVYSRDSLVWDERWIRSGVSRADAGVILRIRCLS